MSDASRPGGGDPDSRFVRAGGTGSESRLRSDLEALIRAALAAVEPARLVRRALESGSLTLPSPGSAGGSGDVLLLAVGKAAPGMLEGALPFLGERVRETLVLAPAGVEIPSAHVAAPLRVFGGGHPLPDSEGVRGARAVLEAVRSADPDCTILFLLSGGGSALLTLPPEGVGLGEIRAVTRTLMERGADIRSLNVVRKHLDRLKGGGLARAAAPRPVRAAVISDVVGDPLDVIASGPVSPDPTSYGEALAVLRRVVGDRAPAGVLEHLEAGADGDREETPGPDDRCFDDVRVVVVGSAGDAVAGARAEAEGRGYRTRILDTEVAGEARDVGRELGRLAGRIRLGREAPRPPACVLAAGESTVTVTGDGLGGRNQEVALGAAEPVAGMDGVLVASVGTDGVDGPTDAAGAFVTGRTLERARRSGLDPGRALERNDSHPFFRELGDLVTTGPTGTNVMDLMLVLVTG